MTWQFLCKGIRHTGGRNNTGQLTSYKKGGGHKTSHKYIGKFTIVKKITMPYFVLKKTYVSYNKTFLNLVNYKSDLFFNKAIFTYVPAILGVSSGSWSNSQLVGNVFNLKSLNLGDYISYITTATASIAQYSKAPGSYSKLLKTEKFRGKVIQLSSKEKKVFPETALAVLGRTSGSSTAKRSYKAGTSRHKGIRPVVRGTAMNPVDHPHGGGEGKTRGKLPRTFTGKLAKGLKTKRTIQKFMY